MIGRPERVTMALFIRVHVLPHPQTKHSRNRGQILNSETAPVSQDIPLAWAIESQSPGESSSLNIVMTSLLWPGINMTDITDKAEVQHPQSQAGSRQARTLG